ncbi:replicase [Molossus molossus circovirus 2]|uniref:replicase n=1 Tax=Molossus molossus circovirus 2 TaxID=1959843 RepID=UPI000CA1789E|nr:replicase [Molossus molossus circovirus 2]AQR57898.1 replicase [Molossus molossus circovirus 2]
MAAAPKLVRKSRFSNQENEFDRGEIGGSSRSVCFTLNNYTENDLEIIKKTWPKIASYYVVGLEVGESGTPHLQGYVEWNSSKEFSTMHKIFSHRAHWKRRYQNSTAEQAAKYCKKGEQSKEEWEKFGSSGPNFGKNANFFEHGEISNQGERNDIKEAMSMIKNGATEIEVFEACPRVSMQYLKGMDRYRLLCQKQARKGYNKKNVRVYWGETGTGKTRSALEEFPDAFICTAGITGLWWDGYDGEETVIIDEFRGNNCPLSMLLTILDGYASQVSIRGGSKILYAKTIIITSNIHPDEWYVNSDDYSKAALKRRIDSTLFFSNKENRKKTAEVEGNTRSSTSLEKFLKLNL